MQRLANSVACSAILALALWSNPLLSDESGAVVPEPAAVTPSTMQAGSQARLLKPNIPQYPAEARRKFLEGWVQLSFSVRVDGTVADPVVEDSSGRPEFEKAALASILQQRFQPATWNGKPVEQCAAGLRFNFLIKDIEPGGKSAFVKGFKEAVKLTEADRMAEAEAKLEEMSKDSVSNRYEAGRLWILRSGLQSLRGDKVGQLRSLERALAYEEDIIEKKIYLQAMKQMFALQVELQRFGPALKTYAKLKKLVQGADRVRLDKVADEIGAAIDGDQGLSFSGPIEYRSGCAEGRPNWQHEILRRQFAFDVLEGKVSDFELRCDWRRVVDKIDTTKTWKIPADWGWCQVFVFGDVGARVKLIEYPLVPEERGFRRQPLKFQ